MSALAIVVISAILMSGVGLLASSQTGRQQRDADYAHAMQLAEAGINYELNCSSNGACAGNSGAADTSSAPHTGSISGVSGSFSTYANSTTPTVITATGTVGSGSYAVSRTVQVNVSGSSVFNGAYALFGTQSTTISNNALTGNIGSNATVSGSAKSGSSCHILSNCATNYQTCDTICNKTFSNGWGTLSNSSNISNQCSYIGCYWSSWFQINSPGWSVGANYPPAGTSATTFTDYQCSCYAGSTLILQPHDYYCTSISLNNSSSCLLCDNATACVSGATPGPCRLWCGTPTGSVGYGVILGNSGFGSHAMGNGLSNDNLCCTCKSTSSEASLSTKCFYDKPACTCTITCQNSCTCGFYGVCQGKSGSASKSCTCKLDKCTGSLSGTVIADNVNVTSATTGTVSSADISNASDPQTQGGYGFSGGWTEITAPGAGAVFVDGTNY